jgi:acyl-CoA synthetase (AMP-forming)/AMP-acid ligase II
MEKGLIEGMGASMPAALTDALTAQFGAAVFVVYAMTECQPIACVPRHSPLAKPGSVRQTHQLKSLERSSVIHSCRSWLRTSGVKLDEWSLIHSVDA